MGTTRSSLAFTTDRGAEPGLLRPACSGVQWQQCRPELRLHPGSVRAGVRTTATAAAVPTVRQPATWRTRGPSECDAAAAVPAVRAVPATSTPAAGLLLKAIRTRREVCTLQAQVERSLLLHPLLGALCRLRRTLRHRPPHSRKRRREHHWRCLEWLDPQPQHRLSFGSHRGSRLRPCHPPALSRKDLHESDPRDLPLPGGGNERWLCHLPLYQKYSPDSASGCSTTGGSCGSASLIISVIFAVFSFYWTTQVISNVALTTIAGIFGSFYFSLPDVVQKHVTLSSFRRTMTYSFGSIAEGSLIVALLDVLRAALTLLKNQEAASGDTMGAAIACCASCCVGCIRGLVDYFNRYAYIEIAMFGKKYTKAAKDAWNLLKKRGIDALVNDCLVNNIWTFGSFACGAICSFFAYIYLHQVRPSYIADNSNYYSIILLYAFLVGFQITHSLGYVALSSGVSTIFVALGEAPQALAEKDPELFAHIAHAYPQVVTPV